MASVSVFNANTQKVSIEVNNGTKYTLLGASSSTNFAPTTIATSNLTYTEAAGTADTFGPGANSVLMTPASSTQPRLFTVNIPSDQQITSLQLYMFWATAATVSYVLLNNGQLIAQQTVGTSAA